jgi:3-deoxy-D-manno-octulosonic acid (KDO) 8-phosphate synthase
MSQSDDAAKTGSRGAFLKNVAVASAATGLSGVVGETFAQTGGASQSGPAPNPLRQRPSH